jgi:hypothetical protein
VALVGQSRGRDRSDRGMVPLLPDGVMVTLDVVAGHIVYVEIIV